MPPTTKKDFIVSSLSRLKTDLSIILTIPATIAIGIHIKNKSIRNPTNERAFSGSLVTIYTPFAAESHLLAIIVGVVLANKKKCNK